MYAPTADKNEQKNGRILPSNLRSAKNNKHERKYLYEIDRRLWMISPEILVWEKESKR